LSEAPSSNGSGDTMTKFQGWEKPPRDLAVHCCAASCCDQRCVKFEDG
jgi:hypothetical protein